MSKYLNPAKSVKYDDFNDIIAYDWSGSPKPYNSHTLIPITIGDVISMTGSNQEDDCDRKLRFLRQLNNTCLSCSMCNLGKQYFNDCGDLRDPHVFSNMCLSKYVIIGKNPSIKSLGMKDLTFGFTKFINEIAKYNIKISEFYVTSLVKCYSDNVIEDSMMSCIPFLKMELRILDPKLIIILDDDVYHRLCTDTQNGGIIKSDYGNIYRINDESFEHRVRILCKLMKA